MLSLYPPPPALTLSSAPCSHAILCPLLSLYPLPPALTLSSAPCSHSILCPLLSLLMGLLRCRLLLVTIINGSVKRLMQLSVTLPIWVAWLRAP